MDNFNLKKFLGEKSLLNESTPGYDTRKFGEALPTLESVKAAHEAKQNEDDVKENMYIDDEEFEMEMGRSKKDSLKKEMMMHVDQLMDGNIDMIDFMNVVEEIMLDVKIAAKDEELNKRKNNG
tara:strand:- start:4 stop:372 length:369 start_codon:yes stop_codon:yes gene_type:complete